MPQLVQQMTYPLACEHSAYGSSVPFFAVHLPLKKLVLRALGAETLLELVGEGSVGPPRAAAFVGKIDHLVPSTASCKSAPPETKACALAPPCPPDLRPCLSRLNHARTGMLPRPPAHVCLHAPAQFDLWRRV